ncbi:MAG: aldo/keto reductase [Duodenibacillus sp.]|nr:aldo/keto reductase [Duodenibacillus sp.]
MLMPRINTAPFAFPKIIIGTMTFGEQTTIAEAHAQLDWAYAEGHRFLDCAEMYPVMTKPETQGLTEEYIGRWLRGKDRSSLLIASKVTGPGRSWIRGGRFTVQGIREAVEGSLRRLQTDYIDLYQIHWPSRSVPVFGNTRFTAPLHPEEELGIREQLEVMGDLVKEGKIRAVGLSNETPWGVCAFANAADDCGLPRIVSLQNAYSLTNRQIEQGLDETCYREGIAILAYSPLAAGTLTGKYLKPGAVGRFTVFPKDFSPRYTRPAVAPAVKAYVDLAEKHGLTPVELALGFACSRPFINSVILGATTLEQLKIDVKACSTPISGELLREIDAIHQAMPNPAI